MRRTLATLAVLVVLPFTVSALTVDELRAQIEQLIAQINALQGQLGAPVINPGTPIPVPGGVVAPPGSVQCPFISRSLKLGSEGDDVARLQRFLALDRSIYPEAIVSGHYGPLTAAAVKRFQCKNKIVCDGTPEATGYGVTGPRTAALLALQCPDVAGNAGGFIRVTPVSGAAPLNVAVEATVNTPRSCTATMYELDFGDSAGRVQMPVPANVCAEVRQTFNHTYTYGGSYTITLRSGTHQTSAAVSVSGAGGPTQSGDTLSGSPLSGAAPLAVNFMGLVNSANACSGEPYSINFGDGQTTPIQVNGCTANSFAVTHTYTGGNFIARLLRGSTEIRSVSISTGTAVPESGGFLAVTPGYGGDVYSVEAEFDLDSTCTRYDIDWGDGSAHSSQSQGSCGSGNVVTKRLSHTYEETGSYTITLKRGANLSTIDTVGVSIVY